MWRVGPTKQYGIPMHSSKYEDNITFPAICLHLSSRKTDGFTLLTSN
jgi:hypothetical protein